MRRHTPQGGISKLDTVSAKAVGGMVIQVLVGGEQIHGGEINRSIPASAASQAGSQLLHALPVAGGQKQGAEETPGGRRRAVLPMQDAGNGFHDG